MEKITNNSIAFIIAYLLVFAVVQISTILSAFSHEVPVIIYSSFLDFNSLTSAASDEVWKSVNNVISIFGSAIVILILLLFISLILLLKWRTRRMWIQRILFWTAIHSFIRLCTSFICGHIFYLWGFNLVTDFIGLTFPSQVMKSIFVFLISVLLLIGIYFFRQAIIGIINPFQGEIKEQLKNNLTYPAIIGSLALLLIFFPITNKAGITEVANTLLTPILIITLMRQGVQKKFTYLNPKHIQHHTNKEKLQLPLLIITLVLSITLRLVFDKGIKITPNTYDNYILDNLLSVVVISSLSILSIYLVIAYYHHHKKQQIQLQKEIDTYKSYQELKDHTIFNYDKSPNLDKYNKAWEEAEQSFKQKK